MTLTSELSVYQTNIFTRCGLKTYHTAQEADILPTKLCESYYYLLSCQKHHHQPQEIYFRQKPFPYFSRKKNFKSFIANDFSRFLQNLWSTLFNASSRVRGRQLITSISQRLSDFLAILPLSLLILRATFWDQAFMKNSLNIQIIEWESFFIIGLDSINKNKSEVTKTEHQITSAHFGSFK